MNATMNPMNATMDLSEACGTGGCGCATAPASDAKAARTEVRARTIRPAVDIVEREGELVIRADVPGASDDAIEVRVEGDELFLTALAVPPAPEGLSPAYAEMFARRYQRTFRFDPRVVEREKIAARATDGVLEITLPKRAPILPRKIAVARA